MSATSEPPRLTGGPASTRFRSVLWAEWIKFRTVRGWIIALIFGAAATFFLCYETAAGPHTGGCTGLPAGAKCTGAPTTVVPTGPGGTAVADTYEFVHRTLTRDGTVTAEITSLAGVTSTNASNVQGSPSASRPGLSSWAKAGLLLTPGTTPGSAYAAVMATGSHGIRFQYNYTHDTPGVTGTVTRSTTRWLRLTRSGDSVNGYASTNGHSWTKVGSADLSRLPATVQVGLFVTSPLMFHGDTGYPTLATATFAHLTVDGGAASGSWHGQAVGTGRTAFYPTLGAGSYRHSGPSVVVSGSGDVGPAVVQGLMGTHTASSSLLLGLIVGLLVVIVVAAMFVTTEYRRGLIRTTFIAIPARGQVLAAKGLVVGGVAFVLSLIVMAVIVPLGPHLLRGNGNYVFAATALTEARIAIGASAVVALAAITAIALSAMLRRAAAAITAGAAIFLSPFILASAMGAGASQWLLRLTPAAGLSMLQALPHYGQVSYAYTFAHGYYPLTPLAGFAVLCGYTLLVLAAATLVLHRRRRMTDALGAEWTKLRTLPSTGWLLVGAVGVTIAVSVIVAGVVHLNAGSAVDPTKLSLSGIQIGQAVVAVLAVLATSEEYDTGMIRVSLTAIPRRPTLLAAKAANLAGLSLLIGFIAVAGCLLAGRLLLPGAGIDPAHGYALVSLSHAPTLRAGAGSVLYVMLIALLSLGVATAIRNTAASIGAVLGLLYLAPIAAQLVNDPAWRRHIDQIAPTTAGLAIQATTKLHSQPLAPWTGLGVLAAWVLAALLAGGLLLTLRDP